ncbi:MAG: hypothetical protein RJA63_363 [Pseudomonadota bacterium]|jgi:hypothetical protein
MGEALIFLVGTAAVVWFVADSLRAREAAITAALQLCKAEGLQFLDDSAALNGLRIIRAPRGSLAIQRTYAFEFSDTGDNRRTGQVTLLGTSVTMTYTGLRSGIAPAPERDQIG